MTLQFEVWPWKTIGHLFYATSSFVHHFVAIGDFKLELQSGNAQFGSNSTIFRAAWPWNLTYDLQQGKSEGFDSCDPPSNLKLDSNCQFFRPCDREIWWMTLQNNRAPLLCYFKLCASFRTHWWIQTWVTVQKAQSGSNLTIFRAVRPWTLTDDLEKQKGTSSMLLQALCSISYPLVNSTLSYSPETPNLGQIQRFLEQCDLKIW